MPSLLDHLAAPDCRRRDFTWDRYGIHWSRSAVSWDMYCPLSRKLDIEPTTPNAESAEADIKGPKSIPSHLVLGLWPEDLGFGLNSFPL
jgi:hypothetical protein